MLPPDSERILPGGSALDDLERNQLDSEPGCEAAVMYLVDHPPAAHPQPVGLAALRFCEVIVRRRGIRRHFSDLGHNRFCQLAGNFVVITG